MTPEADATRQALCDLLEEQGEPDIAHWIRYSELVQQVFAHVREDFCSKCRSSKTSPHDPNCELAFALFRVDHQALIRDVHLAWDIALKMERIRLDVPHAVELWQCTHRRLEAGPVESVIVNGRTTQRAGLVCWACGSLRTSAQP